MHNPSLCILIRNKLLFNLQCPVRILFALPLRALENINVFSCWAPFSLSFPLFLFTHSSCHSFLITLLFRCLNSSLLQGIPRSVHSELIVLFACLSASSLPAVPTCTRIHVITMVTSSCISLVVTSNSSLRRSFLLSIVNCLQLS